MSEILTVTTSCPVCMRGVCLLTGSSLLCCVWAGTAGCASSMHQQVWAPGSCLHACTCNTDNTPRLLTVAKQPWSWFGLLCGTYALQLRVWLAVWWSIADVCVFSYLLPLLFRPPAGLAAQHC